MKKMLLAGATMLGLSFLAASPAFAGVFDFSYTGFGDNNVITGTFTTGKSIRSPIGSGVGKVYRIIGMTGTFDGSTITKLLPVDWNHGYFGNDNAYYSAFNGVDFYGVAFADAAGDKVDLYSWEGAGLALFNGDCGPDYLSNGDLAITPAQSVPVPEPGSFLLLGTGLIGLGFVARRRRARNV